MKYLMILMLWLSGCSYSHIELTNPAALKFKAGEQVMEVSGFYSGCHGSITGFAHYYDTKESVNYNIDFTCAKHTPNEYTPEALIIINDVVLPESDLKSIEGI